jgi:REP element-mobilizing transposase RayT
MSLQSYSKVWLHLTWATLERRPLLSQAAAVELSAYLREYSVEKGIYMRINYVNADHVHALIDLPTGLCIEEVLHLFKGSSSHWVNENNLCPGKFAWGRGYGAFSVSHSGLAKVAQYIANQEKHHRKRSFAEELSLLVRRHHLKWHEEKTAEAVPIISTPATHPAQAGC